MKTHIALLAAVLSAASNAGAQSIEAAYAALRPAARETAQRGLAQSSAPKDERKEAPKDAECKVCWDSSFTPLNEKAKAVKAWEDKKSEVSATKGVVGIVAIGALLSPAAWNSLQDGARKYREVTAELAALRAKAAALDAFELKDGVVTKIKLVKGVDYKTSR